MNNITKKSVMLSGYGKMGKEIANEIPKTKDLKLYPHMLTSKNCDDTRLIDEIFNNEGKPDFIIDYTTKEAGLKNAKLYIEKFMIPFVMGTTIDNTEKDEIEYLLKKYNIPAVIAPNMARVTVEMISRLDTLGSNMPDCYKGYKVKFIESHHGSKDHLSGTAKDILPSLRKLGLEIEESDVIICRKRQEHDELKVPEEYRNGHSWHIINIYKEDGTAKDCFSTRINGRGPYIEGTLDAVRYLGQIIDDTPPENLGGLYSMKDVFGLR